MSGWPRIVRWSLPGALLGGGYFAFLKAFPAGDRLRGDAAGYLELAGGSAALQRILEFDSVQGIGLPLLLSAFRNYLRPLAQARGHAWFEWVPYYFFLFHVGCLAAFWWAVTRWTTRHELPRPHPLLLLVLLGHPGLIAGTTLLLTDTLTVDTIVIGVASWLCLCATERATARRFAAFGALSGAAWAAAVLLRPTTLLPVVAGVLGAVTAWAFKLELPPWKRRTASRLRPIHAVPVALLLVLVALPLVFASRQCERRHGEACLVDPVLVRKHSAWEAAVGPWNVRTYWSKATSPSLPVLVADPWLHEHVSSACSPVRLLGEQSVASCFLRKPQLLPVLVFKKTIAVVDQQHYQSYTVERTPPGARLYFRSFSLLVWLGATIGLVSLLALFRMRRRRRALAEGASLLVIPASMLAGHCLVHVESRYVLVLVPFSYLLLGCLLTVVIEKWKNGERTFCLRVAAASLLAAMVFAWQVWRWDELDETQQRIDAVQRTA
jgi:hypothetical protein